MADWQLFLPQTGTLTQNRMSVVNIAIGSQSYTTSEARSSTSDSVKVLAAIAGLCNDASFEGSTMDKEVEKRKVNGDATGTLNFFYELTLRGMPAYTIGYF